MHMDQGDNFYTMKGYERKEEDSGRLTTSMEDYLEMIYRIASDGNPVHVGDLSRRLHVRPSSATKMMQQLGEGGYIQSEKYGMIFLTEKGCTEGRYLLDRHRIIHSFLCALNHTDNELEQAEKIEHFLNRQTVENLRKLTERLESDFTEQP